MESVKDLASWLLTVVLIVILGVIAEQITESYDIAITAGLAFTAGTIFEYRRHHR